MKETVQIGFDQYQLDRYPKTTDKSLRAWSNAELLVLDYVKDTRIKDIYLYNDRFGVWNCALHKKNIITVWTYASQKKAITQNLRLNELNEEVCYKTPLDDLNNIELALIKIPKSLELFELILQQIHKGSSDRVEVVCGFMTKYFSVSFIKIAEKYFEVVEQSKAWKKARLLILKKPIKIVEHKELINSISWNSKRVKQFYGVFSSRSIDIGTQFFLEHLEILPEEMKVLDLASGNGIIATAVLARNPKVSITLLDDFNLAIASSKLNIDTAVSADYVCNDTLEGFSDDAFDLVVSNPPFHFEFENNIEISLSLFKDVKRCLREEGRFLLVANKHLNYKTHLITFFDSVKVLQHNSRFEIIECYG